MFTTIITDCKGENEAGRQISRFNSLGLSPTTLIGVESTLGVGATIEAGANLVDTLDATDGKRGVIVVNVAPRGDKNDGSNGTLFAYFHYKKTLVISTIKGHCLSFVNRLGIINKVNLLETEKVLAFAAKSKLITKEQEKHIVKSQFRSFDFVPRVAKWLLDSINIPSADYILHSKFYIPPCVWCIDAFGNAKTTLTNKDLALKATPLRVKTSIGSLNCYERLKDVPHGETALYIGSSGLGNTRFIEIATQGVAGSAAKTLDLKLGDNITLS